MSESRLNLNTYPYKLLSYLEFSLDTLKENVGCADNGRGGQNMVPFWNISGGRRRTTTKMGPGF